MQFTCDRGHSWNVAADRPPKVGRSDSVCPVCGGEALAAAASTQTDDAQHDTFGWEGEGDPSNDEIPPFRGPVLSGARLDSLCRPAVAAESQEEIPPPTVVGYEIIRLLGRGGMGAVHLARHELLNREVALKVILEGAQAAAENRARFKSEAEAVARLHHPNIVQIFEFGEDQGRLFLALEFVDGQSLQKAAAGQPQPPRDAADLVQSLAAAVQFAHDRGIIHRDLKPSNILLTVAGEPKIADFGLAKNVQQPSENTLSGAVVGTPNYMAPEQASGGAKNVGPAADIYALGAILYWLLVGRPPFHADSVLEVLRQVVEHEPPSVRLLNPKLDRDLDTICSKCLQKDPHKRYASAGELGDDLGRYLRGEAIAARPLGRLERLDRWRRRNPRIAALSAALIGVFLAGFAAVTWQWRQTVQQREEAEENLEWATMTVRDLLTSFSENRLLNEPGLQPLRRELLQRALAYYELFASEREGNERLQHELAVAHFNVGKIHNLLGDKEQAIASLQESVEIHERLCAAHDSENVRRTLATVYGHLAEVEDSVGELDRAAGHYDSACKLLREFHQRHPHDTGVELEFADYTGDLAYLEIRTGAHEAGLARFPKAVAMHEKLLAAAPRDQEIRTRFAAVLNNWGIAQRRAGQLDAAIASIARALELQLELKEEFPKVLDYQEDVAISHFNLGSVQRALGQSGGAASSFGEAEAAYGALSEGNPTVSKYQQGQADCLCEIATLRMGEQAFGEAESSLLAAIEVLERLTEQSPNAVAYHQSLRNAYNDLVNCQYAQDEPFAALAYLRRAAAAQDSFAQKNPGLPEVASGEADIYNSIGNVLRELGDTTGALPALDRALEIKESLAGQFPDVGDYQSAMGLIHANRAKCFVATGDADGAIAAFEAAESAWRTLIEREPSRWQDRNAIGKLHIDAAELYGLMGRPDDARHSYEKAVAELSSLAQDSNDAAVRFELALAWHFYGALERQQEDFGTAHDHLARAAGIYEQVIHDVPEDPFHVTAVITNHLSLGDVTGTIGDHTAAVSWYTSVIEHAGQLRDVGGDNAEAAHFLKRALTGRAAALESLGRADEAADDLARAAELNDGP